MLAWLRHRPAWLLLTAPDEDLARAEPQRFSRAWIGLLGVHLLWGLAMIGLWNLSRFLLGYRSETYLLSGVLLTCAILFGPFRRGATRLAELIGRGHEVNRLYLVGALLLLLTAGLSALRSDWHVQEIGLLPSVAWLRPGSKADRVLLLMPLWGVWAMLIVPHFCRDRIQNPAILGLARGCGPLTTAVLMGGLLAVTIGYFAFMPWTQLTIPAATIAAGIGGGCWLGRRQGVVDRGVLLSANLLAQTALLLAYLANRDIRFW